jgi:hypothetical protein
MSVTEWEEALPEGSEFLTPELRAELAAYSEKDLLMPFITVWARKRVPAAPSDNGRSQAADSRVAAR